MSEDLRPSGDVTTQLIKKNNKIKAKIISNENCIIGGLSFAKESFKYSDKKIIFKAKTKDGKKVFVPDGTHYNVFDEKDVTEVSRVELTKPTIIRVNEPHQVVIDKGWRFPRVAATLRKILVSTVGAG